MQITFEVPDHIALETAATKDPSRFALEAFLAEAYRRRLTSESEMARLLGYDYRPNIHGLLAEFGVCQQYNLWDLQHDMGLGEDNNTDPDEIHQRYDLPTGS